MQRIGGYIVGQAVYEMCRGKMVELIVDEKGFTVIFAGGNEVNKEIFKALKDRVNQVAVKQYRVVSMTRANLREQMKFYGQREMAPEGDKRDVLLVVQGEGFAGPVEVEVDDVSAVHLFGYNNGDELSIRGVAAEGTKELKRAVARVVAGKKSDHQQLTDLYRNEYWTPEGITMRKEFKKRVEDVYQEAGCVEVRGDDLEVIAKDLKKSVWQWDHGESLRGMMSDPLGSQVYFFRQDHTFLLQFLDKMSKMLRLDVTYFLNGKEVETSLSVESGDTLVGIALDGYAQPLTIVELEFGKGEVKGTICESVEKLMVIELENK